MTYQTDERDQELKNAFIIGAVGAPLVLLFTVALALGIGSWWSWWLYPGWGWFVVPLGVPAVSFWHFWGLWILFRTRGTTLETKPKETAPTPWAAWLIVNSVGPIAVWAVLRWIAS